MDAELAALEARLAQLVDYTGALREANATLQRDLDAAEAMNQALARRMQAASTRLDALMSRLPEA